MQARMDIFQKNCITIPPVHEGELPNDRRKDYHGQTVKESPGNGKSHS